MSPCGILFGGIFFHSECLILGLARSYLVSFSVGNTYLHSDTSPAWKTEERISEHGTASGKEALYIPEIQWRLFSGQ